MQDSRDEHAPLLQRGGGITLWKGDNQKQDLTNSGITRASHDRNTDKLATHELAYPEWSGPINHIRIWIVIAIVNRFYSATRTPFITIQCPGNVHKYGYRPGSLGTRK